MGLGIASVQERELHVHITALQWLDREADEPIGAPGSQFGQHLGAVDWHIRRPTPSSNMQSCKSLIIHDSIADSAIIAVWSHPNHAELGIINGHCDPP